MSKDTTNAAVGTAHTTDPLTKAVAKALQQNHDPEFVDSPGAKRLFGLGRSYLYRLHADGLIQGVSLRKRGQSKGKRLWNVDSIRRLLGAAMKGGVKE
jgi:hypothetical protein